MITLSLRVADDLELELLPPEHALLHQDWWTGRWRQARAADRLELLAVVGDAAARAAQGEARGG